VLDIALAPLALQTANFNAGDTVRITVSFQYKVGVDTSLTLLAAPYYTNIFGRHLVEQCQGQADLLLEASFSEIEKTAAVDMSLVPKSMGGIENGTYGLVVWLRVGELTRDPWALPGPLALVEQDNVLIVTGNSTGGFTDTFSSIMPMLMMVMMMGMVTPMLQGMGEEEAAE
jgi:hypothetical protein